jgi:hypothetical protein
MSTKPQTKKDSAQAQDIAVDVRANDLVHVGIDSQGDNHYLDVQRDRIIVTAATHDEYTNDGSVVCRRSLVAGAADVERVIDFGDSDLRDYVQFVAARVDDRDWESVTVTFIDLNAVLGEVA